MFEMILNVIKMTGDNINNICWFFLGVAMWLKSFNY